MIRKLFRRKTPPLAVVPLYENIVQAARRPALYRPPYGVADTLEGRFDLVVLHAFLVMRRLTEEGDAGRTLAQALSDHMFTSFDRALREMGVGDLAVPKRMAKLGEDYNGRSAAYTRAFAGEEDLAGALARNVLGSGDAERGRALAHYAEEARRTLSASSAQTLLKGICVFPDPAPHTET
ncbi:MAG: ubiquinol-cytochrome C chaperone [Hyphomicrobiales bacterium]|nr:ubiquinol-cytochrome C chaperone [Hyphomicrobiales bacterium]